MLQEGQMKKTEGFQKLINYFNFRIPYLRSAQFFYFLEAKVVEEVLYSKSTDMRVGDFLWLSAKLLFLGLA
jgi:hypothetical protein